MRVALRLSPVILSAVLLAAHFSRSGSPALVLASLAFPLLLLVRRPWSARTVQVLLLLGGIEWLRTAWRLASRRAASGEPWGRLVLILGTVALVAFASALVFRSRSLRPIWLGDRTGDGTAA